MSSYGNSSIPSLQSTHQQMQQSGPARSGTNNQPNPLSYHQQYASYGSNLSQPQPYGLDPNQSHLSPYGLPGQGQPTGLNKNASYSNYPGIPNSPRRPTPGTSSYQSSRPLTSGYGPSSNPIHGLGPPPGSNIYSSSPYSNPYGHAGPGGPNMPPNTNELWPGQIHQTRLPYPGYGSAPNSSSTNLAGLHANVNSSRDGIASSSSYLHGQSSTYSNSSSQLGTNSNINPLHGQRSYYNQTGMPAPSGLPNPSSLSINSVASSHSGIQNDSSINSLPFGQPYGSRYPQYGSYSQQTPYDHQQGRVGPYGLPTQQNQSNSSPNYRPTYSNTSSNQMPALSPRRPTPTPPASSPMPPPTSHTPDRGPSVNTITNTTINSSSNNQLTSPGQTQSSINASLNQKVSGPPPPSSNSLAQLEQMVMPHLNNNSNNKQNSSYFNLPGLNSSLNNSNNNLAIPQQPTANSQTGLIQNNNYPHYSPPVSISQIPGYYSQYGPNSAINTSNNSMWPPTCQIQNLNTSSTTVSKSNTHSPLQNSSNVTYSPATMAVKPQTGNSTLINKPAASSYNLFDNQYQSPGLTDNSYLKNSTNDNTVLYSQQSNPSANLSQASQIAEGSNDNKISTGNSASITNNSETESQNANESSNYYEMMQQSLNVTDNVRDKTDLQRSSSNNQSQRTQNYINQDSNYINQSDPSYLNQQQPQPSLYHQNQQASQQSSYSSQTNLNSSYSGFQNDSFEMGIGNNQVNNMSAPFNNSNNIQNQHDSMSIYDQSFNSNTGHPNQDYGQLSSNNEMSQVQQPYDPYDDNFANEPALHGSKKKTKGRPKKDMIEQKKEKKPRQPRTSKANKNKPKISPGTPTPGNLNEYENPSCYPLSQQPDLYNQLPNNSMQSQMMPSHMSMPIGHPANVDSSSQVPNTQHPIQPIISQQIPSAQNEIYPSSNIGQMQSSSIPASLDLQNSQQPTNLYENQLSQVNQLHINQQPQENLNNSMIQSQLNTNLQPTIQPSLLPAPGQNQTTISILNDKQTILNSSALDKNESVNAASQNENLVKNDLKVDQPGLINEKNTFNENKKEMNVETEISSFNKDQIFHKELDKKETSSLGIVPDNKSYDSTKAMDRASQMDFSSINQNLIPTTIENIPASSLPNLNQSTFNQQPKNIPLLPPLPPPQVMPPIAFHGNLPVQISQVPVSLYNNPNYLPNQHIRPPFINANQMIETASSNQMTIINTNIQHVDLNCQVPIQDIQMVSLPTENLQYANESMNESDISKTKKTKKKKKKIDEKKIDDSSLNSELEINSAFDEKSVDDQSAKKAKKARRPKKPKKENLLKPNDIEINDQNATLDATIIQDDTMTTDISLDVNNDLNNDSNEATQEGDDSLDKSSKKSLKKVTCSSKPKKPKLKEGGGKSKKKLPKLALKFSNKKKRKRLGSSDGSDVEKTPPSSPKEEDNANKRRSSRNTKKLKYHEDIDIGISDDDDKKEESQAEVTVTNIVEDTMVVEKIMSSRMGTRELELEDEENKDYNQIKPPTLEVEEFYVKYKNLSYLHCEWRTEEELERNDKRVNQKLKRYKQKRDSMISFDFQDDEPFNPDYCEVDRVLDFTEFEEKIPDDELEVKNEKDSLPENEKPSIDVDEKIDVTEEGKNDKEITKLELDSKEKIDVDVKIKVDEQSTDNFSKVEEISKEEISKEVSEQENLVLDNLKEEKLNLLSDSSEIKAEENKLETKNEVSELKVKTRKVRHFLVKWKGLPYEESTWELEEDLDPIKVANFFRFREVPPKDKWKLKKKPKASDWKKKDETPNYKNGNKLREYQLEGVNWLMFCWYNNRNCILADEMGLGKTIQSITYIQEIYNHGVWGPFLVIVPLSTIGNWQREFETWTDLNVITYHGSSASRNTIQQYEMYYKNEKGEKIEGVYKFQVMITTFEVILTDCIELSGIPWKTCVIDEAHRLKNRNCKLLEGLRLLSFDHRVLLTGTPLQNNVEELFSLLNFLEPIQFGSSELFVQEFGDLKTEDQVTKLKALLKPMMLRRLKEDVEKSLAPKEETIIEVELTNIQKKYYRAILEKNFSFLNKGTTNSNIGNLMNTMMELRKCCIHPFLINGAEEQITYEFKQTKGPSVTQFQTMVQSSGKLVLIDKLLPRLKADGHRVLIFSQMVRCLDILEDYLIQKRYPFERIDGRVRGSVRQAAIDRYSKPGSDRFVFLLCTRAGGLGINLTAADTVIIFDSDWNPQNDLQAQARCHRIGQKKMVKIYRLICRNTYEREMFDKASLKLGLDKAVLQSMNTDKSAKGGLSDGQLSKKEIEDLLKKGAYGALMDDDNAGDKFCEEDIEQILQRRTQVVTIESEEKGSTFSKASFAASDNRSDIELDDPNFWEKWAKKANLDVEEVNNKNELIVEEPRRRVQTRRFGQDDGLLDISDADSNTDEDDDNVSNRTRGGRGQKIKGRDKKGRRGRGGYERDDEISGEFGPGNWTRSECYKIEKGLLTFGWGRWEEILESGGFRRKLETNDIEDVARVIALYCCQNYKGDEKIKSFAIDLITPIQDEEKKNEDLMNNLTKRQRAGRKKKDDSEKFEFEKLDWAKDEKYNPDLLLNDDQYRKHLVRHANKIILRIKLLFYIKHEIIGNLADQVQNGTHVKDLPMPPLMPDGDSLNDWWDEEADKSLVVGIYKHGFDHYSSMRLDPALCFLSRCGPPDGAALLAELNAEEDLGKTLDEDEDIEASSNTVINKAETNTCLDNEDKKEMTDYNGAAFLPFPSTSDLNQRLRKIVTAYQRNFKKQEIRLAQQARNQQRLEKLEKFEAATRERENKKREQAQKKWSRREENEFCKVVSMFGVEYNPKKDKYNWNNFRTFSKFDKKMDETLTEYYKAFYAMCKRVTGKKLSDEEENLPISVDAITEDKATRCLLRIDLLSKIREEILPNKKLDEKLKLCQHSIELPSWWISGKHDKDLLVGVARYGLARLDYNLMNDPKLSFKDVLKQEELKSNILKEEDIKLYSDTLEKESYKNIKYEKYVEKTINELCDNEGDLETWKEIVFDARDILENILDCVSMNPPCLVERKASKDNLMMKTEEQKIEDCSLLNQNRLLVKWPKDRVLLARLENVCHCIEKNEWPVKSFFNNSQLSLNSTLNIDSSPKPPSPASLSSMSREPTPHPTPDHTPRRECNSPSDFTFTDDRGRKRRRRGIVSQSFEQQKQSQIQQHKQQMQQQIQQQHQRKLQESLKQQQQLIQQQQQLQQLQQLSKKSGNNLLNNQLLKSLFPSLLNLPFNGNDNKANNFLNDEKTAALFLQNALKAKSAGLNFPPTALLSAIQAATNNQNNLNNSSKQTNKSSIPPPAHQSLVSNKRSGLESMDLTFTKTNINKQQLNSQLSKLSKQGLALSNKKDKTGPILDLSSGPTFKKDEKEDETSKKSSKKIGSRIDALALNLQAKKMQQDPKTDNVFDYSDSANLSEMNLNSLQGKSAAQKLENLKKDFLLQALNSNNQKKTSSNVNPFNNKLLETLQLISKLNNNNKNKNQKEAIDKNALLKQNFKKILDEHPDLMNSLPALQSSSSNFLANNPSATSSKTATSTSSFIPANTELIELPDNRRKVRNSTQQNTISSSNVNEENFSSINMLNAANKKLSSTKNNFNNKSSSNLSNLNSNLLLDLGQALSSNSPNNLRTSSKNSDQKNKLNLESALSQLNSQLSNNKSRTTAASLLAAAQNPSNNNNNNNNPFANLPGFNPLAGLNPNLMNLPGLNKILMEQAALAAGLKNNSSNANNLMSNSGNSASNKTSSNQNSASNTNPFLPFSNIPGFGNLNSSLLGLSGFNLPGLNNNLINNNLLTNEAKNKDNLSTSKDNENNSKSSSKQGNEKSSNNQHSNNNSSTKNKGLLNNNLSNANLMNNLPFLPGFPNSNLLNNLPFNPLSLSSLPGLQNSPFANLAQNNLLNGIANFTGGLNNLQANKSKSSNNNNSNKSNNMSNNPLSKAALAALGVGGNNQFNLANMASLLQQAAGNQNLSSKNSNLKSSSSNNSSNQTSKKPTESDDESLKSLMGHEEDDDDLNGDIDENEDSGSDYEASLKKRSKNTRTQAKRKCTEASKSKK